jgi:hypothetical protein
MAKKNPAPKKARVKRASASPRTAVSAKPPAPTASMATPSAVAVTMTLDFGANPAGDVMSIRRIDGQALATGRANVNHGEHTTSWDVVSPTVRPIPFGVTIVEDVSGRVALSSVTGAGCATARSYSILNDTEPEMVRVRLRIHWSATNYGDRPQICDSDFAEDEIYKPSDLIVRVKHLGQTHVNDKVAIDDDADGDVVTVRGQSIGLSRGGNDGDRCEVDCEATMLVPRQYSHVLSFGRPVLNPKIHVGNVDGYELKATLDGDADQLGGTWTYRAAYIKGHHPQVWWKPKPKV